MKKTVLLIGLLTSLNIAALTDVEMLDKMKNSEIGKKISANPQDLGTCILYASNSDQHKEEVEKFQNASLLLDIPMNEVEAGLYFALGYTKGTLNMTDGVVTEGMFSDGMYQKECTELSNWINQMYIDMSVVINQSTP